MSYVIYFFTICLSNIVGAISGMGGGVIIKPVLDALKIHPLVTISFYSSIAVFTMSISSTLKQVKSGKKIDVRIASFLSIGSILGGILGDNLFLYLIKIFNEEKVQLIQIFIMIVSLIMILVYMKLDIKSLNLESKFTYFILGMFLGAYSTLLGIGGGPINVACLAFILGFDIKKSVLYSIVVIFFSQLSKIIKILLAGSLLNYDLKFLIVIIPAAIIGGYLGGYLNNKLSEKKVAMLYNLVVIFVIFINVYNGYKILM
ncbi:sulfite exporter TauE/SafE family protein [Miniphocaeibacter massiliensis]|uniref:sulfite exporter TauE/SafE family protein n=1 Tax=Miniphocaeibacter massiliensis TaxID=2041841 RepID=UPI000C1C4A34|nr:sulfite exporter TauE/SafE family protein [Miniphocaeibacter massiliensis]